MVKNLKYSELKITEKHMDIFHIEATAVFSKTAFLVEIYPTFQNK